MGPFRKKNHLEGTAELLFRQYGSCHGLEEKNSWSVRPFRPKKEINIFLIFDRTGLSIVSQGDDCIVYSSITDRLIDLLPDSGTHIFRFTEFPSELNSNTLLRQLTHFTVRLRKKYVCFLLQIASVTTESNIHSFLWYATWDDFWQIFSVFVTSIIELDFILKNLSLVFLFSLCFQKCFSGLWNHDRERDM
jgi:hypothetical protein